MVLLYLIVKIFCHYQFFRLRGIDTRYCNTFIIFRRIKAGWMNDAILHGPSMLPDKAKFVECSIISLALSFWMKQLVIGQ